MTNKTLNLICYIALIITLIIVYFACYKLSYEGYGYPGYKGYHRHHSYFYYARHDSYYGSSVRENSVSGSRFSQKGIHGGK